jgi:hypothetical protein
MREEQTGYLGVEETLSTISIASGTLIPKIRKKGPGGSERKTFRK